MTLETFNGAAIPEAMKDLARLPDGSPIPFFFGETDSEIGGRKASLIAGRRCALSGKDLQEDVAFICTPNEALIGKFFSMPMLTECAEFIMSAQPKFAESYAPGGPGFFVVCVVKDYSYCPEKDLFEAQGVVTKTFWDNGTMIPSEIVSALDGLLGQFGLGA